MGSIVKGLFGGSKEKSGGTRQESSVGGFSALPADIQDKYRALIEPVGGIIDNFNDFFRPRDLSNEETQARGLLNPDNIEASLQKYLNPFQNFITDNINKQFEAPQSMLTARASEAGAFGGSRFRSGQADLEKARLDAIGGANAQQYNNAFEQLQGGISNLLGFGALERELDMGQRQALPASIRFGGDILSKLLNANQSQGTGSDFSKRSSYTGAFAN